MGCLYDKMRCLPKADLHLHLDGSVPTVVVADLIRKYSITLPEWFDINKDLQVLRTVGSLQEYFRPWFALKRLPVGRDCLDDMLRAVFKRLAEDNVRYVELRNSPFNIGEINQISLDESLDWLVSGIREHSEPFGVNAKLIVSLSRYEFDLDRAFKLLRAIRPFADRGDIVGVDLSGDEQSSIPREASFVFRVAKEEIGLGVTIHAGETGSTANIEWAVKECRADRIGHGLAAVKDVRLLEQLQANNICAEVCLLSNYRTGSVELNHDHPVRTFIEWEIPFILCSDNPAIHGANLTDDYVLFDQITSRSDIIDRMFDTQRRFAFSKELI